MKKLITALVFFIGLHAQAGLISVELDNINVNVGDVVGVTIVGTDFDAFDALNVDVEFDTTLFSLDELSLGGDLYDTADFTSFLSSQSFGAAFSFLDFAPFAGGDFIIATFNITALELGTSKFTLANISASDFFSGAIDASASTDVVNGTISTSVPAPQSLALFALTLVGLFGFRQKLKS